MTPALVYRSPWIYEAVMLALYGRHYPARYRAIAGLVPPGSSVLDLCCGPAILFERYLKREGVDYTGIDMNEGFVRRIDRIGGRGLRLDLRDEVPLPTADVVLMQASLYHFLPDPAPILARMRAAARRRVVIAEPIRNLSDSRVPVLSAVARRQTDPGSGSQSRRFTERTLDECLAAQVPPPTRSFLAPGGREKIYVIDIPTDGAAPEPS